MKRVKMLTAVRESMARKASSAMAGFFFFVINYFKIKIKLIFAEVRETREELKIKELLILDLTKKQ
jgi:hypothetical protein